MKALIKQSRAIGDLSMIDLPMPTLEDHQLIAKVAYAGICGSDLDIINNLNDIYKPPVVQGHEFSAIVESIGSAVDNIQVGDKIVSETLFEKCCECLPCLDNNYHLCENKKIVGWTENGGFADYVLLNSNYVHKLDKNADIRSAALIEPSAIAAEALFIKGRFKAGESLAVIGPGATGIISALMANITGASNSFLIGRKTSTAIRFPIAEKAGIKHCINSSETDPSAYINEHNSGHLVDIVIDATGSIHGFNLALDLVKRNGRIIELGSITEDTMFPWQQAAFKAIDLHFVFSSSNDAWKKAVSIFNSGKLALDKLITSEFSLDDYQAAFKTADDSNQSLKVLFNLED